MARHELDSNLSLAILGLLSLSGMSGYDLRKVFRTTAMTAFSDSPGAIYPALRRLEKDGLIEGAVERKNTLRPRRVFSLTRRGRAALVAFLKRPVTREDVVHGTNGLLLRFAFMGGLVDAGTTIAFLDAMAEETEGYLRELEAQLAETEAGFPFTGRAALEHGVDIYRTTARWARRTLAGLRRHIASKGGRK
jgi:DNA-binding PadR family transcriptional regulator